MAGKSKTGSKSKSGAKGGSALKTAMSAQITQQRVFEFRKRLDFLDKLPIMQVDTRFLCLSNKNG